MVPGLNRHQRKGQLHRVRREPPRRGAHQIRLRTARLVLEVFESGEEPLILVGAVGAHARKQRQRREVKQLAITIDGPTGVDRYRTVHGGRGKALGVVPPRPVRVGPARAKLEPIRASLDRDRDLSGLLWVEPSSLTRDKIAKSNRRMPNGHDRAVDLQPEATQLRSVMDEFQRARFHRHCLCLWSEDRRFGFGPRRWFERGAFFKRYSLDDAWPRRTGRIDPQTMPRAQ